MRDRSRDVETPIKYRDHLVPSFEKLPAVDTVTVSLLKMIASSRGKIPLLRDRGFRVVRVSGLTPNANVAERIISRRGV